MSKIKDFFKLIGNALIRIVDYNGFMPIMVPDDEPYREITPYSHSYQIIDEYFILEYQLSVDGPKLVVYVDQNGKQCVEDVDGKFYRIKN